MSRRSKRARKFSMNGSGAATDSLTPRPASPPPPPTRKETTPPPNLGRPIVDHIDSFMGRINSYSSKLYLNPDEAYRQSRTFQSAMRRDPVIMSPLRQRQLATALLDWQITPEDESDCIQKQVCESLTQAVKKTPFFLKFKMALMEAVYFGRYGVNVGYSWKDDFFEELSVDWWRPIHGDKLAFEHDTGNVGIYVSARATGEDIRHSTESRVRMISPEERKAVIVHSHEVEDGEFFEAESAGMIHGVGLRSRIYWPWWLKHNALQWLLDYMERVGLGISIWFYEHGDPQDEAKTRALAQEFTGQSIALVPMPIGTERPFERMKRVEAGTGGAEFFKSVMDDYWGAQIREMIIGQSLTQKAEPTGMGSSVADQHRATFDQIVAFDSDNLGETITREFIHVLATYNFIGIDWTPRFEIVQQEQDPKALLEAAKVFQDMGGEVGEDQIRGIIGLGKPEPSERILKRAPAMPGEGGGDGGNGPPPSGGDDGGPGDDDDGPRVNLPDGDYSEEEVRRAMQYARWKESEHPRDDGGKFTGEGAGANSSEKPGRFASLATDYAGENGLASMTPIKTKLMFESIMKYPGDYGLSRREASDLGAAIQGIQYGVRTGRLSGPAEMWWMKQQPEEQIRTIDRVMEKAGKAGSIAEYYEAFRQIAIEESEKQFAKPTTEEPAPKEQKAKETRKKKEKPLSVSDFSVEDREAVWAAIAKHGYSGGANKDLQALAKEEIARKKQKESTPLFNDDTEEISTEDEVPFSRIMDPIQFGWRESDHPRDNDGQFSETPGGGSSGEKKSSERPSQAKEAELAERVRVMESKLAIGTVRDSLADLREEGHAEKAKSYHEAASTLLKKMSFPALERFNRHVERVKFYPSLDELRDSHHEKTGSSNSSNVAAYFQYGANGKGELHLDGDDKEGIGLAEKEIYAHEFAHAVDGSIRSRDCLSTTLEWNEAYNKEIEPGALSDYAATSVREGFAEFGRLAWTNPKLARKKFPQCWAFWKSRGLV